ncbi:MAG: zf-HC2 domain-containing protein [Chloracidobacterium sp.]|nr:zf-HC2 domain-containing protein [Chloracidobacterium sp.]
MNCDECKNLISVFMDDDLDEERSAHVREHLGMCNACAHVCEDLASIIDVCATESPSELLPPNSKALWCRISNTIENEKKPDIVPPAEEPQRRLWRFSFVQGATAVLCIAVVSSLVTIVALQAYLPPTTDAPMRSAASQTTFEKFLGQIGLMETPHQARERRIKEQQAAIDYWNERVQTRRVQWDRTTRDAFDRNLQVIDESVNDYTMILSQDPEDELSGEMLDSVLDDKMNLLRDFSDL